VHYCRYAHTKRVLMVRGKQRLNRASEPTGEGGRTKRYKVLKVNKYGLEQRRIFTIDKKCVERGVCATFRVVEYVCMYDICMGEQ
jgi:hypothetical protein